MVVGTSGIPVRAVVGTGAWGTTIAAMLAGSGPVTLLARTPEMATAIDAARENVAHLPGVRLPAGVRVTADEGHVAGAQDLVVMAVPAEHMRAAAVRIASMVRPEAIVVSVAKGIERGSLLRMSEVLCSELAVAPGRVCALSGPNLALEVAAGQPASAVAGATDEAFGARLVDLLASRSFRVYRNRDLVGVELAGALKNIVAIAAGAADALRLGDNAKAAIVTRGLAEDHAPGSGRGCEPDDLRRSRGHRRHPRDVLVPVVAQPSAGHGARPWARVGRDRGVTAGCGGGGLHGGRGAGAGGSARRRHAHRARGARRALFREARAGLAPRSPVAGLQGRARGHVSRLRVRGPRPRPRAA